MTASSDPTQIQSILEPLATEHHASSVLNRLLQWIERLPIPYPIFCLGFFMIATVLHQIILVFNVKPSFLPLDINSILNGYVMAYSLALILYVKRSARQALSTFAPALDLDQAQYRQLQSTLTNLPTVPALLCGLFVVLASVILNLVLAGDELRARLLMPSVMMTAVSSTFLTYSMVGILMYDLIHKLWLIGRIYSFARKLDLFNQRSLYAFSDLTARILAGWLLLSYPNVFLADLWRSPAWLSITGVTLGLMVIASAYALLHIERRIKKEKAGMVFQVQSRLQNIFAQLHERMDNGTGQELSQLKLMMDCLIVERDTLNKISTWPWETETLTKFSSVVLVPVGVWLFQTGVKKLLGL